MLYDNDELTMTSDFELDKVLSDFNFDLLKENMREQISLKVLNNKVNYLQSIENKFMMIQEEYSEYNDIVKSATETMEDLYTFILDELCNSFNLFIPTELTFDDKRHVSSILYNELVLRCEKNMVKFMHKYVCKNKKALAESVQDKKKDVSTLRIKKMTKNKDDVAILSNFESIFKSIIHMDFDERDYITYNDDIRFENMELKHIYGTQLIGGNFVSKYFSLIRSDYYVYEQLSIRLYTKLMKKVVKGQ